MQAEAISLYYKDAGSDKEYHAQLEQKDSGWVVLMQYGRAGGTLTSGAKTKAPVAYAAAKAAYDKVVKEKVGKGYSPGQAGSAFVNTSLEERFTGIVPQLLNGIDDSQAQALLENGAWVAQPKHDGHRRLVQASDSGLTGINRKGLATGLPAAVAAELACLAGHAPYVLDGELIGEAYVVFDLLEWEGEDLRSAECSHRLGMLQAVAELLGAACATHVTLTESAYATKRALYEHVKAQGGEGLVFKRLSAPYVPGRPNSGGSQLKLKFTHRATVVVSAQHATKRSVAMVLRDAAGGQVAVGNVTVPTNYPLPPPGALVEVEYLYAFPGGSLFQPQFLGERTDVSVDECTVSQLHLKPEGSSSEDEDA